MPAPIWNENSKSYLQEEKSDPKDRIDVIIGDDKDPSVFHPQFKLQRWDNEANVSFRLDHSWLPGTKVTNDELNGVITWTKKVGANEWIARFYEDWGTTEGAYKFVELVLPAKPPTNQISFTTTSKDVDFFYQPALTPEEIAEGAEQPEEVVGSYAIYSTYRGGMNDVKGKDYKAGKIGHLYRAKLIDANGDEIWADYNTDLNETGILTITADQTWLDNAVYPVIVDPTFGYTSAGGSNAKIDNKISGSLATLSENGDISSITFHSNTMSASRNFKCAIYDSSKDYVETGSEEGSGGGGDDWYTSTVSPAESLTAADYWLVGWADGANASIAYDGGGPYTLMYEYAQTYGSWPSSLSSASTFSSYSPSIYATYTPTTNNYPTVIGSITTGTSGSGTSHTVTSGTDALIVTIGTHQGSISNVQWDGNALTLAVDADTAFNENAEIWYLNSPTAGTGNITYSSTGSHTGWAAINVDGCDTIDGTTTTSEEASTDGDLSITTPAAQCLVIDAIYSEADVTNNNPDTTTAADLQGASYENFGSQYVTVPPSSTKDMRWSLSSGQRTAHVAIALEGVSATSVEVTPNPITATLSLPAPTVTTTSSVVVTPSQIDATLSLPTPSVSVGDGATPAAVTGTLSLPAPTVTTTTNIETTPSQIDATLSLPAPSVSISESNTVAQVDATLSLPTPTVTTTSSVSVAPNPVTITTSLPDLTVTVPPAFSCYAPITIDADQVSGTANLTNFPVLISGTYDGTGGEPDLRTVANGGGIQNTDATGGASGGLTVPADLAFYSDSGLTTQLDHEFTAYNASTGAITVWVEIPTLDFDDDTVIYMAYGDSSVTTSQEDVAGTWGGNYDLVAHLEEAENTSAGGYKDSTGTYNGTGVSTDMTAPAGQVGTAAEFDGSADYIKFGDNLDKTATTAFSVSLWLNTDTQTTHQEPLTKQVSSGAFEGWYVFWNANRWINYGLIGDTTSTQLSDRTISYAQATWYHIFITYSGTPGAANWTLVRNGSVVSGVTAAVDTLDAGDDTTNAAELNIGARDNGNLPFNGIIDEVRVHSVQRTEGWAITEYNNQSSPSTFYTIGSAVCGEATNTEVTADVVTGALSIPAPTITGAASITPNPVTTTLSIPTPTISAIQNVTITPDPVTATASLPTPSVAVAGGVTTSPSPVTTNLSLPEATISGSAGVTADLLTNTVSLPAPTITTTSNATVSADVVTLTTSLPTPTVTGAAVVTADVVTITTSLPTPAYTVDEGVTADVITAALSLPAPTVTGVANVTADLVNLTTSLPSATLSVDSGYSGNSSWGIDINTFGLVMTKSAKIPTWTTASRPTGRKGMFGFNKQRNCIEIYNPLTSAWSEFNPTPTITVSDTEPSSPETGDLWVDTS